MITSAATQGTDGDARERILASAYELFSERGIRAVLINVLLEMGSGHVTGSASVDHLANIRALVRGLAEEAGLRDPDAFAHSWHILMKGSIVSAAEGNEKAAQRAQALGRLLIDAHR
jgi:hypothetical protein